MQQQTRGFYSQMPQVRPRWNAPVQTRFNNVTPANQQARQQVSARPITGQAAQNGPRMATATPAGRPPMQQAGQNMQRPTYKFAAARNMSQPAQAPQQMPQQAVVVPGQEPLTAAMLAAAPPSEQKQMLGERLFPLIASMHSDLAGKITGMLLEIDNTELLHMLESQESLKAKVCLPSVHLCSALSGSAACVVHS